MSYGGAPVIVLSKLPLLLLLWFEKKMEGDYSLLFSIDGKTIFIALGAHRH
jgi:hypothetical protein